MKPNYAAVVAIAAVLATPAVAAAAPDRFVVVNAVDVNGAPRGLRITGHLEGDPREVRRFYDLRSTEAAEACHRWDMLSSCPWRQGGISQEPARLAWRIICTYSNARCLAPCRSAELGAVRW